MPAVTSICVKSQHMQHTFLLFFDVLTEFGVDTACMAVHYPWWPVLALVSPIRDVEPMLAECRRCTSIESILGRWILFAGQ